MSMDSDLSKRSNWYSM